MKITIELLSDLCVASGETYNSMVDTDVVYDELGLPYIPAKRIKGCIREAALEMMEMGLIDRRQYLAVFGEKDSRKAGFTLSNAYIRNHTRTEEVLRAIRSSGAGSFASPQNVLNQYTDIRKQTAVDLETGVAEKNSLRTIRVVRKGLVFEADCNIAERKNLTVLKQAVSLVKHMGISRTRGLGLVDLCLEEEDRSKLSHVKLDRKQLTEYNRLRYQIHLNSALICKSAQGNQAVTEDYIAGSKVLGILAGALGKERYRDLMAQEDELIISNAYITSEGVRCTPGRSSLQKQKDQPWDIDGKMIVRDMLYQESREAVRGMQMTPAGIGYISPEGVKMNVRTEITYHHQRPADKSIGHATGENDGSSFYQLCSISSGQTFAGYIYANREQAEQILDALEHTGEIRMGYGRSSEFGAVDFVIDEVQSCDTERMSECELVHKAVITLVSDVILYNESGALTTEVEVLFQYLREALKVDDLKLAKEADPYLKFVTAGGYNVTWGRRKPIINALGKGSTFMISSDTGINLEAAKDLFTGERAAEGFGEILVEPVGNPNITVWKSEKQAKRYRAGSRKQDEQVEMLPDELDDSEEIVQKLLLAEFERRMQSAVRKVLEENRERYVQKADALRATAAKLRILYVNESSYEGMLEQIAGIEKEDKNKLCTEIARIVVPDSLSEKIIQKMKAEYGMTLVIPWTKEQLYKNIYRAYTTELKYLVRRIIRTKETERKEE